MASLSASEIYNILLLNENVHISSIEYWSRKFPHEVIDFRLWFSLLFNSKLCDRKHLDFNWKLFHGLVNTEVKLKRMSYSDGICTVCKCSNEDIEHLLVDCKHVEEVWSFVETCFTQYSHDFNTLTRFMKILGILSKGPLWKK